MARGASSNNLFPRYNLCYYNLIMKYFYLTVALFLFLVEARANVELKEFYTDGCTLFMDNYPKHKEKSWRHCCVIHDLRYWYGGNKSEKDQTDLDLKACVEKSYSAFLANLMYRGIRIGNSSPIKHKTHWGWGWVEKKPAYFNLTEEETQYVKTKFETLDLKEDKVSIPDFINRYLSK